VIVRQMDLQPPVQSVPITTNVEFEPRSWRDVLYTTYGDLRHVGGFLRVLCFPELIKLTVMI
jgi:hypothetical protein